MDTRDERRRKALQHTFQQLRDVTSSSAYLTKANEVKMHNWQMNKALIIVDASKYIKDLKQKVEGLSSELGMVESSSSPQMDDQPMVSVKTLEKGFLINVILEKNSPGILVSILEAFEDLGLDVLDARVSCEDTFQLQAVGGESRKEGTVNALVVKQAVLEAIKNKD